MVAIDLKLLKPVHISIPTVSTRLNKTDYWGAVKVRWGIGRNHYTVNPGLYKIGNPTTQSDVFVSANYKLSFDALRKNLHGFNAWILVIDTKGINVWCAASKGTFGTNNLSQSIKKVSLESIVKHRTIIVPQLGATGVSAHRTKELTGFRVVFGPVQAKDITAFIENGYKASPEMRKITFPIKERAKLIPVELTGGKYKLLLVAFLFFMFAGLDKSGFFFNKMLETFHFPIINVFTSFLVGVIAVPLLLPFVPVRSFAFKGALLNIIMLASFWATSTVPTLEIAAMAMISTSIASFTAMCFTGSSTYTSLSGVKKEMKWAIPLQITIAAIGFILFTVSKLI